MLTPKENLLETLKQGGKPECLCNCYTMFRNIINNPCSKFIRGNRVRGTNSYDQWGTHILFPADAPGAIPHVTPENQVIQDICEWQKYVKIPDLIKNCSDGWEEVIAAQNALDRKKYLAMTNMPDGIFEQMHMLMTFEDTLMNFLLEPEAMHGLIDALCEYRLTYMKLVVENLHPDCIVSQDDWGSKNSLFFSVEVWREFFKEPYRKLYSYLHENNVIVMHHADSYCEPLVEEMAEIGIDIWQGVLPSNNIAKISEKVGDRMLLMGGIDAVIDREDASEAEIRREARRACEEYGHLKGFWPGMTYGLMGSIYPHVEDIVIDEINRYNQERFGCSIS